MGFIIFFILLGIIVAGLLGYALLKRDIVAGLIAFVATVCGTLFWFYNSYTEVPTGHGGVVKTFGKVYVEDEALTEGLNWVKPWQTVVHMSHQQFSFDRNASQGNAATVQAKDNIRLQADVSFHSVLNFSAMPWILQNYGGNYGDNLLVKSAASAIRSAASEFDNWDDLQVEKRIEFQSRITELYAETVREKMRTKGIPEEVVMAAFEFPDVDLRKVVPVDEILIEQIAENKAASKKTDRKRTEISNAALDAEKRGQDGTAIRGTILRVLYEPIDDEGNLPEGADLPEGVSLAEISNFILAIAEVKRADAVEMAAEKGNLTVMVTGGATPALPLPSPGATSVAVPQE